MPQPEAYKTNAGRSSPRSQNQLFKISYLLRAKYRIARHLISVIAIQTQEISPFLNLKRPPVPPQQWSTGPYLVLPRTSKGPPFLAKDAAGTVLKNCAGILTIRKSGTCERNITKRSATLILLLPTHIERLGCWKNVLVV